MSSTFNRVLFLDGVLHPSGGPPGEALPFCWESELAEDLALHTDLGLVVHSFWLGRFGLDEMRDFLDPLGPQLGAPWLQATRRRPFLPSLVPTIKYGNGSSSTMTRASLVTTSLARCSFAIREQAWRTPKHECDFANG